MKTVTEKRWAFESHSFGLRTIGIFGKLGQTRKDFAEQWGIPKRPLGRIIRVTLTYSVPK